MHDIRRVLLEIEDILDKGKMAGTINLMDVINEEFPEDEQETRKCNICGKRMIRIRETDRIHNTRVQNWWCGGCENKIEINRTQIMSREEEQRERWYIANGV